MPQFRKKPVVIEARKSLSYLDFGDIQQWITDNGGEAFADQKDCGPAFLVIRTLEGDMRADVGDYVIKGVKGEFYPCKPHIFEASYDAV